MPPTVTSVASPTPTVTVEPKPAVSTSAPISAAPVKVESPAVTSADILKRQPSGQPVVKETIGEPSYREDLEKITDPTIKAIAEKQLKDLESGYNKKFQTLAQQRTELEDLKTKVSTWTPQRLSEELKNPAFLQAMQTLQQSSPPHEWKGSSEEWSTLTDSEKHQFAQMRQETQSLQAQMSKMLQSQEDTKIKELYSDYEPRVVDEAIEGLRTGQITASRADIWKVVNHDKNVEKGYQFGYEDGYKKALEKLNGASILPGNGIVASTDEVPDEIRKGGFSSIAMWRLGKSKNGSQQKR